MNRIEKLVRVPARGQGAGLRFAIAHNAGDDQVGIVKRRAKRVRERVAKLAAFVDRAGRLRRDMAGDAAGKGKLLEQTLQAMFVLRDIRIDLAVGAFQICIRHDPRPPVPRTGDVKDIQIVIFDDAIEMNIDEIQPGCCPPMSEQARLDMFESEWPSQQGIFVEVNLPDGEIIRRAPVSVHRPQQLRGESFFFWSHRFSIPAWRVNRMAMLHFSAIPG